MIMQKEISINSTNFARFLSGDISETLCPIIMVTRRPDGTGLYQHYKGVVSALEGSVVIKTLFLAEDATIDNIRKLAWEHGVASIIFCEAFYQFINPSELKLLKQEVSLKIGFVFAWDSTELDPRDVESIDECVDVLFPVCQEFAESWRKQIAPEITVRYLRLPLSHGAYETIAPIRCFSSGSDRKQSVNILSVAGYHPRKNHDLAILAVKKLLDAGVSCNLRIHSNLDQGEFRKIRNLGEKLLGDRFLATHGEISTNEILALYSQSDIYISCSQGEGCNIGLRAALSSGMPIVFTNIPGHRDLLDYKYGTYPVEASQQVPGIYPERSNQAFGYQFKSDANTIQISLLKAVEYLLSANYDPEIVSAQIERQDERRSKIYIWDILASCSLLFTHQRLSSRRAGQLDSFEDILVVPSLDAGFFSIVNTYISHKLFWEYSSLYDRVVPMWSPQMVSLATEKKFENFTSYCYSQPNDGNSFDLIFGYPDRPIAADLNFQKCTFSGRSPNGKVDPNLTYIHSEKLYQSAIFNIWREEMNLIFWDSCRLRPHILEDATKMLEKISPYGNVMAMHTRHPSHALEQRDKSIALVEDYVRVAQNWLMSEKQQEDCAIILATDQDEVIFEFEKNFPGKVIYWKNISRVNMENTKAERLISDEDRLKEGRSIQHLLANNIEKWNIKNAFEVIADALLLSMADSLVHVNSNIATVVSLLNPNMLLLHIKAGDSFGELINRKKLLNIKLY